MSIFVDPHPAMPFFSLPLSSTRPRPIQIPYPCGKSISYLHSPIPKLMTATHSSELLHVHQSLLPFLTARTMWPACPLNPHS